MCVILQFTENILIFQNSLILQLFVYSCTCLPNIERLCKGLLDVQNVNGLNTLTLN